MYREKEGKINVSAPRGVNSHPLMYEQIERLEQLRALENGYSIGVVRVKEAPLEVDTQEDLDAVRSALAGQ